MSATVERYGGRAWCVLVNGELLCVTVYKKGAVAVADLINRRGAAGTAPHVLTTPEHENKEA